MTDFAQAGTTATTAIRLYEDGPGEARSYGCEALARVQLANARLATGRLDEAANAFGGLMQLAPEMRISSIGSDLAASRALLGKPRYRNSLTARRLDRQLAGFARRPRAAMLRDGGDERPRFGCPDRP
jgi:hypothetical protein